MAIEITLETNLSGIEYIRIKDTYVDKAIERRLCFVNRLIGGVGGFHRFLIYTHGNNILGKEFYRSEVSIPASVDDDDLFEKLSDIFISGNIIDGIVDVNIASPLPLPVDIVSPLPVPVDIISPLPIPISGSVTATISGIVYVVEPGCLTQRYTSLDEVPILVYMGAVSLVSFITINPNGSSKFLKIFDTVAAPIIGTTPAKLVFPITSNFLNSTIDLPRPVKFVNGIWIAATNEHTDISTNFTGKTLDSTIFYEL